jgi:hypothetical protein
MAVGHKYASAIAWDILRVKFIGCLSAMQMWLAPSVLLGHPSLELIIKCLLGSSVMCPLFPHTANRVIQAPC